MNGLIDFQCEVYESGYEILSYEEFEKHGNEEASESKAAFTLVGRPKPAKISGAFAGYIKPIDTKSSKRIFNLTDYPGAYSELVYAYIGCMRNTVGVRSSGSFAPHVFDSLIKFANKYGLLTNHSYGERIDFIWLSKIMEMDTSISFLGYIKDGNLEKFEEEIITTEDGKFAIICEYIFIGDDEIIESSWTEIPTIGQTPPRDRSEAAYHHICSVVNKNLKDLLVTEIIPNRTNTGTEMFVRPNDLLSALWLQLAHALSRNLEFKQCSDCSTFFEVKSKKRRFEKIYCSDRCRVRVGARKRRDKEKTK